MYFGERFPYTAYAIIGTLAISSVYQLSGSVLAIAAPDIKWMLFPWIFSFAQIFLMLIPVLIIAKFSPLPLKKIFRFNRMPPPVFFIIAVAGIFFAMAAQNGIYSLQEYILPESFRGLFETWQEQTRLIYKKSLVGEGIWHYTKVLFVAALIPAVCEEFLFRGFMQRHLEVSLKPWQAIALTALIFDAVHFNPVNFLPLLVISFYLCFLAYYSKSIIVPMTVHFINNAFAVYEINQNVEAGTTLQDKVLPPGEAALWALGGIAGLIILLWGLSKLSRKFFLRGKLSKPLQNEL